MVVSRELAEVPDKSSIQKNSSRNYISEANYIEFAGVKVFQILWNIIHYFLLF